MIVIKGKNFNEITIRIVVLAMFAYHLWIALTGVPEPLFVRPIHVAFVLFLGFLKFRASKKTKNDFIPWYDWVGAFLGVMSTLYLLTDYDRINMRMPYYDPLMPLDWICGIIAILLVLEIARRTVGKTLVIFVAFILVHTLFGKYFPGVFSNPGISPARLLDHLYLTSNGLFGSLASLSMAQIFMFIMFGSFLQYAGGETLFFNIASAATKNTIGGPAKSSVIGSALFGSISGSGTANVFATGSVTIPLMIKNGYKPHFAAAVESVASSLGQLIPPVMGASAFLIAEFSQRPYLDVAAAAIVPSLLYIYAVYLAVHFEAKRMNLGYAKTEDIDGVITTLYKYGHILISVAVLVGFLVMRKSAYYSATMALLTITAVSWLRASTRLGPKRLLMAIESGIHRLVTIAAVLFAAGIAVSAMQTTGTVYEITNVIVQFAQGKLIIAVLLVAITVIILGMGLPPTGAFLVASVFGAAALQEFGIDSFVTYMFIFMFGLTSMITPPVCTSSFAAASIAGTSFMKTGIKGFVIGIPSYIIPIMIIYNPTLLMIFNEGIWFGIQTFLTAVLGITCLVSGIAGMLLRRTNIIQRLILIVISLVLVWPGTFTDLIGITGFTVVLLWQIGTTKLSRRVST